MGLSPKQRTAILESLDGGARVNAWHGSVRSGKTMSSIVAWCEFVRTAPPGRLFMIAKTGDTLRRNVLDEIDILFGDATPLRYTPGANTARLFDRTIDLVGANDAKSESRIRGATAAGSYVDEWTLLPSEQFWLQLRARHLTVADAKIFTTTNPDNPRHWAKTGTIDKGAEVGAASWHFDLDDNPVLTDEAKAEAKSSYTGVFYKRMIQGLWVVAEGAIFPMWDEDRFVVEAEEPHEWLAFAADAGSTNRSAGYLVGITPHPVHGRPHLHVGYEWAPDNKDRSPAWQSKHLRDWLAEHDEPRYTLVDPAAKWFRDQLREDGLRSQGAVNDVLPGIRTLSMLLDRDLLTIHPRCENLIKYLPGYVWDSAAAARGEDKPLKVDDHEVDALRYAIHTTTRRWRDALGVRIDLPSSSSDDE